MKDAQKAGKGGEIRIKNKMGKKSKIEITEGSVNSLEECKKR